MRERTNARDSVYMFVYVYVYLYVYVRMCICMCTRVYMCTCMRARISTHISIHICMHLIHVKTYSNIHCDDTRIYPNPFLLWVLCHFIGFARLRRGRSQCSDCSLFCLSLSCTRALARMLGTFWHLCVCVVCVCRCRVFQPAIA